jgi:hypothetical protein
MTMAGGVTLKQAAQIMNVSERMVQKASVVMRLRPDLEPLLWNGQMSMDRAYRIARGLPERTKPTSWDRLVQAWNAATDEDRERMMFKIMRQVALARADDDT